MKLFKRIWLFFLFHARNYKKLLELTSFNEEELKTNFDFLKVRYQAYASFHTKNFFHSQHCFEILKKNNKLTSNDYNYIAFLHIRHNEREKAITNWCLALEKNKTNKTARKALDALRKKGSSIILTDDFFEEVTPKEPFKIPIIFLCKTFVLLLVLSILSLLSYMLIKNIIVTLREKNKLEFVELNKIEITDFNTNLLETRKEKNKKYSYSEKEIKTKFERIKKKIVENKAVEAQIEINEILLSNASLNVKLKAEMLKTFILQPDYATFKNVISFEEFIKEKERYKEVYVLWNGVIKNQIIKKDEINFNLFIGDDEKGIIIGIIPVVFKKAHLYKNNDKVHVFGKIMEKNNNYYLEGLYIIRSEQYILYKKEK